MNWRISYVQALESDGKIFRRYASGYDRLEVIKSARSYFSKFSFLLHLKNHHSKVVNSKFGLKRLSRFTQGAKLYVCWQTDMAGYKNVSYVD